MKKKLFDKLEEHNISITIFWNFNGEIKDIKINTAEHDAKVRADAIDEIFCVAKENCHDDGVDYSIGLQVLDNLIEQLKEQNNNE